MPSWGNRQFWADATWRAFRTWAQTMAGILAAYSIWLGVQVAKALKDPTVDVDVVTIVGGWDLWLLFGFAATIAAAISLFQSIDRERAANAVLPSIPIPAPAPAAVAATDAVVTPIGTPIDTTTPVGFCGDTAR